MDGTDSLKAIIPEVAVMIAAAQQLSLYNLVIKNIYNYIFYSNSPSVVEDMMIHQNKKMRRVDVDSL
jgi:hypothetical protein